MCHLCWNGQTSIDFFSDSEFRSFKASLDAEMKRLQSKGIGSLTKQAEVLTETDEELLWAMGDSTPQTLLNTVQWPIFCLAEWKGTPSTKIRSLPNPVD